MKLLVPLAGCCLALAFVACGGGDGQTDSSARARAPRPRAPTVKMTKAEIARLPPLVIPKPSGPPPRDFEIVELHRGSGPPVIRTDEVIIRYVEDTYPDALEGRQGTLSQGIVSMALPLKEAARGFQVGLPGMKVGSRRELMVPPKVAYPKWKPSWGYAPYSSVYVVDLLGVRSLG